MAGLLRTRHMATAPRTALTPQGGELIWDETLQRMYVGNGVTSGGLPIAPAAGFTTSSKTINYAVPAVESGFRYNNIGAGAQVDFTLPAAAAGLEYEFLVFVAQTLRLVRAGTDLIKIGNTGSVTTLQSNAPYSTIKIQAHSTLVWVVSSIMGNWT